jgi:hypothetical protein
MKLQVYSIVAAASQLVAAEETNGLVKLLAQTGVKLEECQQEADCSQAYLDGKLKSSANTMGTSDKQAASDFVKVNRSDDGESSEEGGDDEDQGGLRALLKTDMGLLDEYGCWCYFQMDVGRGQGEPVDEIDGFCRTLHKGYECIIMDHDDLGTPCVPWEEENNSAFGSGVVPFGLTMENLIDECDAQNPEVDGCARKVCKVEGWFVMQYFSYAIFGGLITRSHQHENSFDTSVCLRAAQDDIMTTAGPGSDGEYQGAQQIECCGIYPIRWPYHHKPHRQCCITSTYNPYIKTCCADGSTEFSALDCNNIIV